MFSCAYIILTILYVRHHMISSKKMLITKNSARDAIPFFVVCISFNINTPVFWGWSRKENTPINRPDGAHHGWAQTQRRVAYVGEEGASGRRDSFSVKRNESGTFFVPHKNISAVFLVMANACVYTVCIYSDKYITCVCVLFF